MGMKQELARKLLKVPDNVGGKIPADEEVDGTLIYCLKSSPANKLTQ